MITYVATLQEAREIPGAVFVWERKNRIKVFTGKDIPDDHPESIVVSRWQLREALRQAGKLVEADNAAATQSANRRSVWEDSNIFGRNWPCMENLKNKMASVNSSDFDNIFRAAKLLDQGTF